MVFDGFEEFQGLTQSHKRDLEPKKTLRGSEETQRLKRDSKTQKLYAYCLGLKASYDINWCQKLEIIGTFWNWTFK